MEILAIRGHATRGREVIELLEMLGGINKYNLRGDTDEWFVLNGTQIQRSDRLFAERGFILEEFIEKFPYKVGDKVSSKCLKNYRISKMEWECANNRVIYKLQAMGWYSTDELQPYKEETMEDKLEQLTLDIPDGYEFFGINDDNQVVLAKKQPKYPQTFIEVLNFWHPDRQIEDDYQRCYKKDLIEKFQDLLYARDAYWKIAGDWKPVWNSDSQFKHIVTCCTDNVIKGTYTTKSCILAFPTTEMRDAFYENFKELIEECKYLL